MKVRRMHRRSDHIMNDNPGSTAGDSSLVSDAGVRRDAPHHSRGTRPAIRAAMWIACAVALHDWMPVESVPELRVELRAASVARAPVRKARSKRAVISRAPDAPAPVQRIPLDAGDPITVWIQYPGNAHGVRTTNRNAARDAFHEWTSIGVPVHFVFTPDSASARVRVVWRRDLPERRAGQTTRVVDSEGWLESATVELSTRNIIGRRQDLPTLRAVAIHEVGHVIGLEHSADDADIMATWVRARDLSANDRVAARSLYGVAAQDTTSP